MASAGQPGDVAEQFADGWVARRQPLAGTGLDDHDVSDAVPEDIVQFPGDPVPLVTDGLRRELLPL